MNIRYSIVFLFLLFSFFHSFAQPRWSPEVRSKREMAWMNDSLNLTKKQLDRIAPISLNYQREMDKATEPDYSKRGRKQHELMRKKDADLRGILTKNQYDLYYRRELRIRQVQNERHYDG